MIVVQDLHYRYPDGTAALQGIRLTIEEGEFLLVCGPNGSGKTTLLRHLNGLLQPDSGEVLVDGLSTCREIAQVRQRVGMVFQDADSQIVGETVEEDVAFGPENLGLKPEETARRVDEALKWVGLDPLRSKSCHLLSGGEKRRLAIAGVLAMRPRIIVFDEPFASMDYRGVQQVLRQLLRLRAEGRTLVLSTHDVEKVIAHVDRIVVLANGRIRKEGKPQTVARKLEPYGVRPPCHVLTGGRELSWLPD